MSKHTPKCRLRLPKPVAMSFLFVAAGTASFFLGLKSANELDPAPQSGAQQTQTTIVNLLLQYQPVGGGAPLPLVVTPFMNASQTPLASLQEIHSGNVFPASASDRCRTTNTTGRCNMTNVPVGGTPESQYDLIVDTTFLEFLTRVPLESKNAFVRFDRSACGSQTSFNAATSSAQAPTWCLGKQGSAYAPEYFVTVTLQERNTCTDTVPPAPFCDSDPRRSVSFLCNPATTASTRPWEPRPTPCGTLQCPDGNTVDGRCGQIGTGLAACSTAFSCTGNQLCGIENFGTRISYDAGRDTIVISGERFGTAGGTVSFPVSGGKREIVQVFPGPDWTDTEVRVRIPLTAVAGTLEVHPNTHGAFSENGKITPAVCVSPPAAIRAFNDQFALLSVNATTPGGIQLVSPGFDTTFTLIVHHNDNVGRFKNIVVALLQGAFPDPATIPLERTVITQAACPVTILGSSAAKDATLTCAVPVPATAAAFQGPFTFFVTITDDRGESAASTLLDSGRSSMIGDFNADHFLTIDDAVLAFRLARGVTTVLPEHLLHDTNHDGRITREDALFVLHSLTR